MSRLDAFARAPLAACLLLSSQVIAATPPVADAAPQPAPDMEVAVIGKQHYTLADVTPSVPARLTESEQRYQERLRQLAIDHRRERTAIVESATNDFVDAKLMQAEADKHHTTLLELIKQVKNPEVTEADIRAFYDQNEPWIQQPYANARGAIAQYLTQQAEEHGKRTYLTALRKEYSARVLLEPGRDEVAAAGPSRGPQDARVTIVEFADFECPFCGRMEPIFHRVLENYPRDVRLVFRQMPLPEIHPNAMPAARASVCAAQQGKFWEMHDTMFAHQGALDEAALKKTAVLLGVEAQPFASCLNSEAVSAAIKVDTDAGTALGVNGTPGIFVNGRFFGGAVPYESLAAVIDDELQRSAASAVRSARR